MTYNDRILDLILKMGYRRPTKVTSHAVDRWIERWRGGKEGEESIGEISWHQHRRDLEKLVDAALLVEIVDKEKCTIWALNFEGRPLLVVSKEGVVKTVLPSKRKNILRPDRLAAHADKET